MILVDQDITAAIRAGKINIRPLRWQNLQPASYDMTLAQGIARLHYQADLLDPRNPQDYTVIETVRCQEGFQIHPGELVLASSVERFTFADNMVGQVNGKSSLARLGLQVESAGFFDPGWDGQATLELVNLAQRPVRLYPGMKIAQMVFFEASGHAARPYGSAGLGSHYQGQEGPTPSRMQE